MSQLALTACVFGLFISQVKVMGNFSPADAHGNYFLSFVMLECGGALAIMFITMSRERKRQRAVAPASLSRVDSADSQGSDENGRVPVRELEIVLDDSGGATISILPPRNQAAKKLMVMIPILGVAYFVSLEFLIRQLVAHHPQGHTFVHRFMQGLVVVVCTYYLAEILTGREVLILNSRELILQHRVLGIPFSRGRFITSEINSPHFAQWQRQTRGKVLEQSGICFQVGQTSHRFGSGLTKDQADEIMSCLRPFLLH